MSGCDEIVRGVLGAMLVLGAHWPICWFQRQLRLASEVPIKRKHAVPVQITGTFERVLAFTLVLFMGVEDAAPLLAAWLAGKLAANWQRQPIERVSPEAQRRIRANTLIALMCGVVSMAFAVLGAEVTRRGIPEISTRICSW